MAGTRRTKRRDEGWFDANTLSRIWDVTTNYFRDNVLKLAKADGVKQGKDRRTKLYYARDLLDAWARQQYGGKSLVKGETDPLLAGGTSPALEDYRRQKAELAKLDLAERRGELVNLNEFRDLHMRLARNLRKVGEQLQRKCGHEAWQIHDEGLVACEIEMRNHFEER